MKLRKGIAPDLSNEDYFPSLGSGKRNDEEMIRKGSQFEEIKHGARPQKQGMLSNAPVEIANRFNTLSDGNTS